MAPSLPTGIALTLAAGLMSGNCMLPMKLTKAWKFENTWLVFTIVSLAILPWGLAAALVAHLGMTYEGMTLSGLAIPFLFGAGWGVAQVLFGISVERLGLGLAYAIIVGLGAVLGTLVPLFAQHRSDAGPRALLEILLGVAMMAAGIGISAWGGRLLERGKDGRANPSITSGYVTAIMLAILCGILAPMLNFSFAFGQDIAHQAVHLGNSEVRAAYAVWPIGLAGGFIPNIVYSLYLLRRNRTWAAFRRNTADSVMPILMGILWMGAFAVYGMSAVYLGALGTSVGWGIFQIFMILTANLSGVLTGEWRGAPPAVRLVMMGGVACLICATGLLAMANH